MSIRYPLNYGWRYIHSDDPIYAKADYDDTQWEVVDIPHTLVELPLQYVDDERVATVGWYRKWLDFDEYDPAARYLIRFEGVGNIATVYLDGISAGTHEGAFTPFEIEVPPQLLAKKHIVVAVRCDATESKDLPPFGHVVDYLVQGGIYREVNIFTSGSHYIKNLFCYSQPDVDSPHLYTVQTRLAVAGSVLDLASTKIGFRDFEFTEKGFFLNGRLLKLRGLNRHQDYPHVGYAMPRRQQYRDAEFLKNELHVNLVRTSHYPQSPHFLERCDELGLLVFEELPGWQYVGKSEKWRSSAIRQLQDRSGSWSSIKQQLGIYQLR